MMYSPIRILLARAFEITPDASGAFGLPNVSLSTSK